MGLPPSGSGRILPLSTLNPELKTEIERKQFGPLPPNEVSYYERFRNRLAITLYPDDYDESDEEDDFHPRDLAKLDLEDLALSRFEGEDFSWRNMCILFNSRTLPATNDTESEGQKDKMVLTIDMTVIEAYIEMICAHANRLRTPPALAANGDKLDLEDSIVSCKMMENNQFQDIVNIFDTEQMDELLPVVGQALNRIQVTPENFQTLDFLFIPSLRADHVTLYGFAPKQKQVFVVESADMSYYRNRTFLQDSVYRGAMLAILMLLVPDVEERETWDIISDRVIKGDKENSDWVEQRDNHNCGIYVCTNAFNLAFGYDMKCFVPRDLDKFKKRRMVAEFKNGGFDGPYNYDIMELPPPRVPPAGRSATYHQAVREMEREAEAEARSSVTSSSTESLSTEDDEDEEQRGLEDDDMKSINITIANTITKSSLEAIFPTASQCLRRDRALAALGIIRPESLDRSIAPQFPADSQRHAFMYSFPHIEYAEAVQCSKEDMIQACKNFPVANWEIWSRQPKEFFLSWMITEMGATMARIHKDKIQPCPGMGDGYTTWVKWEAEKKNKAAYAEMDSERIQNLPDVPQVSPKTTSFQVPTQRDFPDVPLILPVLRLQGVVYDNRLRGWLMVDGMANSE